ncbi:hypothetical protein G6F56_002405 [Rhizopus delemar]|nr:hypothetical protein G6F56_002405 [Rhizopus delemar]
MFGCIAAGRLVQTNLQQVDVNKYVFELSDAQSLNHIVVFLLGTIPFEPGFAATVHLLWPNKEWQLLGGLSNEKASAIFRLKGTSGSNDQPFSTVTLGISIEPIEVVQEQLTAIGQNQTIQNQVAIVKPNVTQVGEMAGRILENLYNYVASFTVQNIPVNSIPVGQLTENGYLSMKAFQTWYENLSRKLASNPRYLNGERSA